MTSVWCIMVDATQHNGRENGETYCVFLGGQREQLTQSPVRIPKTRFVIGWYHTFGAQMTHMTLSGFYFLPSMGEGFFLFYGGQVYTCVLKKCIYL